MTRRLVLPTAFVLATLVAQTAAAQDTEATAGTARITERGGIEAVGQVIFQDIAINPAGIVLPLTAVSEGSANVTILADGSVVSLSVPGSIGVRRAGGLQSFTVLTSTDGDYTAAMGLGGLLINGDVLSIDVGGEITVSPEDLEPGEYRGLLVAVAQYN
jgi:hypothetical protein